VSLNLDTTNWKRVKLGDIADASKEKVDPADGSVERYVAGEHMGSDDLKIHRWGDTVEDDLGPAFHRRFHPGQVLYGSRRTYLRKVAVADFDGVCANTTFVIETRDNETLLQEFLPFVMAAEPFHAFAIAESKGSVNPYVNWSDIARYEFDLPPLDEQKRIADLLWAVEGHKKALVVASQALAGLRAAWRNSVFASPATTARLDERADVILGRQRAPQHAAGDHMREYVRSANIRNGRVVLEDLKQMNFTPAEQKKFRLLPGDVLVSEGTASPRELGASAMWSPSDPDREMYFQKTLLRLRAQEGKSTPVLLREWAQWAQESGAFVRVATGTGILHITGVRCAGMPIPVLTPAESAALEAHAGELSDAARAIQRELDHLKAVGSAFADEIFGGP
jgi:hypothetical protein